LVVWVTGWRLRQKLDPEPLRPDLRLRLAAAAQGARWGQEALQCRPASSDFLSEQPADDLVSMFFWSPW